MDVLTFECVGQNTEEIKPISEDCNMKVISDILSGSSKRSNLKIDSAGYNKCVED